MPAGLVLTGGAAQLAGAARLGREVLQMPVRVAGPSGVTGLTDHLLTPAYSTSLGLLMWGAQTVRGAELRSYESAPAPGMFNRMREWARGLLP
jgi:cell division protein FtsA